MREAVVHRLRRQRFSRAPLRVHGCGSGIRPLVGAGRCVIRSDAPEGRTTPTRACSRREGELLYVRLRADSATARQVWDSAAVTVAATGFAGRRLGPPVKLSARILSLEEQERAERAFATGMICRLVGSIGSDWLYLELRKREDQPPKSQRAPAAGP
jgi:hypothetical protein